MKSTRTIIVELGLPASATKEEVLVWIKGLSQKYHPDRPNGDVDKFNEVQQLKREYLRSLPCDECKGTKAVKVKEGKFYNRIPCPKCQVRNE